MDGADGTKGRDEDGKGYAAEAARAASDGRTGAGPVRPRSACHETSLSFSIVPKKQSRAPRLVFEIERA